MINRSRFWLALDLFGKVVNPTSHQRRQSLVLFTFSCSWLRWLYFHSSFLPHVVVPIWSVWPTASENSRVWTRSCEIVHTSLADMCVKLCKTKSKSDIFAISLSVVIYSELDSIVSRQTESCRWGASDVAPINYSFRAFPTVSTTNQKCNWWAIDGAFRVQSNRSPPL